MSQGNPYRGFVEGHLRLLDQGLRLPLGGLEPPPRPLPPASAPRVLLLSPHPDDECVTGLLPLRLQREAGMRVVNLAVTLGSRRERRPGRLVEVKAACRYLGFKLVVPGSEGLDDVTPNARAGDPTAWRAKVAAVVEILARERPSVVVLPHGRDGNRTHEGVSLLGMDALEVLGRDAALDVVETEFWAAMPCPNLLVEAKPDDLADLLAALSFHVGEVRRNPYHLRLAAWMVDNVRRAEVVLGQGAAAPPMSFAVPYRLRRWEGGGLIEVLDGGGALGEAADLGALFGQG
ncbi:MAG: PIG-L family deacetylase [Geminicoccaceae bacterium]|nr:PIG-L family deacetylase [Geminicoccaceae bacterium]